VKAWMRLSLACFVAIAVGCDTEDDSADGRGYMPQAGFGAIVVENDTADDWNTSVDGNLLGRAASGSFLVSNATPGQHEVHLDQHHGSEERDRTVHVSEGLLTVIRLTADLFDDFDVDVFQLEPAG
jgi:hypothetical protein